MTENTPNPNNTQNSRDENSIINKMLSREGEKITDYETMILETQKRVWAALKKGYKYTGITDESEQFLRKNVFSKLNLMVLYVDLVGSTTMTLELPVEKLAIIISAFSQEMATVVRHHGGFVLKFVGDAVIGYFVAEENSLQAADSAVNCAKSMNDVIKNGINPILNQYDYPDLMAKIGLDYGQSIVLRYGSNPDSSHIDLIGPAMNIASKIQAMAKPNQILIGTDVFQRLHPESQKDFKAITFDANKWRYRSRHTGEIYKVYEYMG